MAKQPFYASRGIAEVLIVHEDRRAELHRRRDDNTYSLVDDGAGSATSAVLDARFSTIEGPRLRIDWIDGFAEV